MSGDGVRTGVQTLPGKPAAQLDDQLGGGLGQR